jgi:hypothetical protein
MRDMRVERLDHLGIVAGTCREIGLAEYLDALVELVQQRPSWRGFNRQPSSAFSPPIQNTRFFSDES